jgi:cytoskeleton protein RodZ
MKRFSRTEPSAGDAARLGEELRDARMALGLGIQDLAASLRIRRVYLSALEEGRVQEMPAPAYAIGFVRSYARALGLDEDDVVRRFRDSIGPVVPRKTDLVFPEPVPERGVPAGAVMLVGAVLAVGAYVAWYNWSASGGRSVDAVPPPPPQIEQAAREAAPPVVVMPSPVPAPTAVEPLAAGRPPMAATVPPPAAGRPPVATAPAPAAGTPPPAVIPPPAASAPAAIPSPASPAGTEEGRVVLRAKADTWLQVRDRQTGAVLLNRVLRPGESWAVPAREGLLLHTGNAGGLEILVDGQLTSGLGAAQAVRRDIPLDPERLKAGDTSAPAGRPAR